MNELAQTTNQTPIEMALGIDENGMTTARKLYEFLEMDKSHFQRWAVKNIENNEFYEEGTDWKGFAIVANGNECKDYNLTTDFAKHLSMESHSEKGKVARNYFVAIEDKAKEVAINRQQLSPELQMFAQMLDAMAKSEVEQKRQAEKLERLDNKVDSIKDVVALNPNDWRKDTSNLIVKMAQNLGGNENIRVLREESYKYLNERMGVSLKIRLTNKRRCMAEEGVSKSKRDKLNPLDVIADDKKLIEGYVAIVKEMAIKYGISY